MKMKRSNTLKKYDELFNSLFLKDKLDLDTRFDLSKYYQQYQISIEHIGIIKKIHSNKKNYALEVCTEKQRKLREKCSQENLLVAP
jgi:hypothetical protein